MRRGAITYHSKVSLGMGFVQPWQKVAAFLSEFANCSEPSRVAIELIEDDDLPFDSFQSERDLLDDSYDLYGWNRLGNSTRHQWVIPNADLEKQLSRLEEIRPLPKCAIGPITVNVRIDFKLKNPDGGCLPGQDYADYGGYVSKDKQAEVLGPSRIDAYLSERSTMRLFLCLPYENRNNKLQEHVVSLNRSAQFKLNPKMWKEWTITRSGGSYKKRRITLQP